ncbi:hypothetical protein [Spirosoma validum]|uniref:Uncharacterized protein n=1 Tax=Spirosoma validum TaxID=2771355 RepID=A0A927B3H1_9BACT|nr:hypothetical protein [Spirosoma validum]MBD2754638.1 hypothetical protein [Spirosoma validum]
MTPSTAQSTKESIAGEYYLTGVREVGSGIKLNADSTFEFFFAYGALDRMGQGTWKQQGNQLILNSRPRPPKDFALVTSRTMSETKLTIRIVDPNKQLLRYVEVAAKNRADIQRGMTDVDGKATFAKPPVEAISLRFELCADRYSVFPITNKAHNYYEFRFEPWIAEVFFKNATYTLSDGELEGSHPLLEPGKTYSFERNQ